jgi:ubiquinone/menaquinone biosynthesis C-methylase UbiE
VNRRVCPWYIGYLLANPLRRLVQDPEIIVVPHIREGMKVLEIGPGMGFFTIPMANRVGDGGRVVCIEVQQKMLKGLRKRASR